jgi:coiled-coil domain-containing protein 55
MNISLAPKKKKVNKGSIGYGLNSRGADASSNNNVFGESSSEDEKEDSAETLTNRGRVNQQIAKEQAALRKRAQAAAASLEESVYDYDGKYDSLKASTATDPSPKKEERSSKYIGDLLKASKKRERERDVIYERKLAKEQAEEDAQADYQGKEKFITKAYKRKLEERKEWEQEEKVKEREEEENDVTKKEAGSAFANFYGNFNRNVALRGTKDSEQGNGGRDGSVERNNDVKEAPTGGLGSLSGFESRDETTGQDKLHQKDEDDRNKGKLASVEEPSAENVPTLSMREIREEKVHVARKRYLERKKMAALQ